MSEPTDLNAYRNAKAEPDEDCTARDEYGRKLYTFLVDYEADGKMFGLEILAYDEEEAKQRIDGIRASATYAGKLYGRIFT